MGHVGENELENVTAAFNAEHEKFNDFIIGGYTDVYENLALKVSWFNLPRLTGSQKCSRRSASVL